MAIIISCSYIYIIRKSYVMYKSVQNLTPPLQKPSSDVFWRNPNLQIIRYLSEVKIFQKKFCAHQRGGQKFLPEVEADFFEFVVFCCSNKKNLHNFCK